MTAYERRNSDWSSDVCSSDLVGPVDVLRVAREGGPAEGADAAAEEGADVGRHETREVEGLGDAFIQRHLADVVAVVEGGDACLVEVQQGAHVDRHGQIGRAHV